MNDNTKLLIGSLSNDLYRVVSLYQRGSIVGAHRFLHEAKKWASQLTGHQVKDYIRKIIIEVSDIDENKLNESTAEALLMNSILLQNYSQKLIKSKRN